MKRVLITNDDGIGAEGIRALTDLAHDYFEEVWVFAPAEEASQIGHRVTTHTPIAFEELEPRVFAVRGTPADCTRVGFHLMEEKPDWVWSGINHGGNLGRHDFHISGTMAAVREAAFHGVRGMGASHYLNHRLPPVDWGTAASWVEAAFLRIREEEHDHGHFWSVNLPHLPPGSSDPEVVFCEQEHLPLEVRFEHSPEGLVYRGEYRNRPREEGTDVAVCFGGHVAVSRVTL